MSFGSLDDFVYEEDDDKTGSHVEGDGTGCAEEVPKKNWDPDGDPLARGEGEEPDEFEKSVDRVSE